MTGILRYGAPSNATNLRFLLNPRAPTFLIHKEFYLDYSEFVPQGNKKVDAFKPVYYVIVQGKKVKCDSEDINVVLGCTYNFMHDYRV